MFRVFLTSLLLLVSAANVCAKDRPASRWIRENSAVPPLAIQPSELLRVQLPVASPAAFFAQAVSPRETGLPDSPPVSGPYLDWRKWTPALLLLLLWAATLRWVDLDAGALRIRRRKWNAALLFAGIAGFGLLFLVPAYWAGWSLLLLSYSIPLGLYVTERNRKVEDARRWFTADHLKRFPAEAVGLVVRALSGRGTAAASLPISLLGKRMADSDEDEPVSERVESSRGHRAARELLYAAIKKGATDIHLEPGGDEVAVRIRIDGNLVTADPFDPKLGTSVINIFKVLAALDITDKRRSQDGSFRAEVEGNIVDFRVATQRIQHGEKLSLRILDPDSTLTTLESLGIRAELREKIREAIQRPSGLFLVSGPTGAGKTTTLYAALNLIDASQKNVITVEDPIEYRLAGVNQIEVNVKAGQTIGGALRNILRQDPDVLLIGEIRDAETAALACEAANTGHVVLSTIHANDAAGVFARLNELGVDPRTAANTVTGVLAQRLIRKLCPHCKSPYFPDHATLVAMGLDAVAAESQAELYRPPKSSHCRECERRGYSGRTGVFELIEMTPSVRNVVAAGASRDDIFAAAHEDGVTTLRNSGLELVLRGVTSMQELRQVVGAVE